MQSLHVGHWRPRTLAIAAGLLICLAALPSGASAAARAEHPSTRAISARVISVRDSAKLHLVHAVGSTLYEAGYATGTLPGSAKVSINIDASRDSASSTFTIQLHGGSISGRGSGTAHQGNGGWESFSGTDSHIHGTGQYAHASGSDKLYGAINRRNDEVDVQVVGKLNV